jgi:outer membrane immunogenic protein
MKNMYRVIAGIVGLFALAPVGAAEAQTYNWTGFYAGGNAGYASGSSEIKSTVLNDRQYFNQADLTSINSNWRTTLHPNGFTGGLQGGYNWQTGPWVFGAEVDGNGFSTVDRMSKTVPYPTILPFAYTVSTRVETDWLVTFRPRIGWAENNWLFYVTGGLAVTDLHADWRFTDNVPGTLTPSAFGRASASATKVGPVGGGGIEIGLSPRWSVKAEYLYMSFGSVSAHSLIQANFRNDGGGPITIGTTHHANLNSSLGRVGVNFRF